MQGAPIGAAEGGGDALLSFEGLAQGVPARVLGGEAKLPADELDELIGDVGDEQVSFGADGFVVEDGAQAEFGFQRAEHRLDVGEGDVGPPQGFLVPIGLIAAQAVHARDGSSSSLRPAGG